MSTKPEPNLLGFVRDTCLAPFDMEARERLKSENYFPNAEDIASYVDQNRSLACANCTEPLDETTDEVFKCNVCNLYFCVYCWSEHKHES